MSLVDATTGARTTAGLLRDLRLENGTGRLATPDVGRMPDGRTLVYVGMEQLASIRAERGLGTAEAVMRAVVETCPFALDGGTRVYRVGRDGLALLLPAEEDPDGSTEPSTAVATRTRGALEAAVHQVLEVRHLPKVRLRVEPMDPPEEGTLADDELGAA